MAMFMTADELAARWRRSRRHVNRMAQQRRIPAVRIEGGWRFSLAAVEAYEAAHTSGATDVAKVPAPAPTRQEVRPPAVVDGFTLPADYEPCFPELWGVEAPTKKAALPR